jgi:hypothetical protein
MPKHRIRWSATAMPNQMWWPNLSLRQACHSTCKQTLQTQLDNVGQHVASQQGLNWLVCQEIQCNPEPVHAPVNDRTTCCTTRAGPPALCMRSVTMPPQVFFLTCHTACSEGSCMLLLLKKRMQVPTAIAAQPRQGKQPEKIPCTNQHLISAKLSPLEGIDNVLDVVLRSHCCAMRPVSLRFKM